MGRRQDAAEVAAYSAAEVARYVGVNRSTVRAWAFGHADPRRRRQWAFRPVIRPQDAKARLFSFNNLIEAHVLAALRVHHRIPLPRIRKAIDFLERQHRLKRPLIDVTLQTDGSALFANAFGEGLVDLSAQGQFAFQAVLSVYLKRIDVVNGRVARYFPFTWKNERKVLEDLEREPKIVMIDPCVAFGRPVLAETNIRTEIVAERFRAGEAIPDLAEEYGVATALIEVAIRSEESLAA